MIMTQEEKQTIKNFVHFYDDMRMELQSIEKTLKELESRRDFATALIEEKREQEKSFLEMLLKKYGPSVLDAQKIANIAYETE
jgi:RecA/RadA recombinase